MKLELFMGHLTEPFGAKKYLRGGQGVREGQNIAKNKLVTQLDDLSPGTSALFIYISNIQRTQKYSAVMYYNELRFVRCYLLRLQLTASYVELLSLDLLISRPGHAASLALISTNVVTGRGFAQFSCI